MHSTFLGAEMRRRDVEKALPSSLGGGAFFSSAMPYKSVFGFTRTLNQMDERREERQIDPTTSRFDIRTKPL